MSVDGDLETSGQSAEPSAEDAQPVPDSSPSVESSGRGPQGWSRAKSSASRRRASKTRSKPKKATAGKKAGATPTRAPKYPRHDVERALRIPQALYDQNGGKPATADEAVRFAGGAAASGPWRLEISSAKKYGFLESTDEATLAPTERARRAIAPQGENDRLDALRDAILAAPEISDVYNHYRGENLPDEQFFVNALTDRFKLPADKVVEFLTIFNQDMRSAELIDESGERPRLLDIGRDEERRPQKAVQAARKAASTGATCFVMQPFASPFGGYFNSIFKPAVEQAGLQAIRADAEIFGTGKIMDQIWRGIRDATVLVAELTSKNPNVFYELGLAHALEKPVVLVTSNQEDVPFDLRHIRVILYDQSDPFWGQKLIDKLADNIQSALSDPEDAIFRVDEA